LHKKINTSKKIVALKKKLYFWHGYSRILIRVDKFVQSLNTKNKNLMKTIENNPYRLAGILSGASMKETTKAKKNIKLAKIGKKIPSEFDFSFFSEISRTEESLNKAFSAIEQSDGKVKFSLFWFLKGNSFDETAMNYLVQGDQNKALDIWGKVTSNRGITSRNFSSFNNIGTLKLLGNTSPEIKEGIEIKLSLIESDCFTDFVHLVAGETFIPDSTKQSEEFVDELLKEFKNQFSSSEVFRLFSDCGTSVQKYLSKKFTEEPLHNIESQTESAKHQRKSNQRNAYEIGLKLFNDCKDDLALLKSILGTSDLKYKMAADSLAKEVMQCGVDYFQEWNESKDPSKEGLKLLNYAKSIAIGSQTKERVNENIEGLEEWAKTAPIQKDLEVIGQKIASFQKKSSSVTNAKDLVVSCKPILQKVKNILGSNNELYLMLSSGIASNALGMVIDVVNNAQTGLEYDRPKLLELPAIISNAVTTITTIGTLDMDRETRSRYSTNQATINGINRQLDGVRQQLRAASVQPSNSGGGCYIATMAYGDYDHPQVIKLRKFRDETLSKSYLGQLFIKTYYKYSPTLVEVLRNQKQVNTFIRTVLNQIIKAIKK
jgi:hypothetical protein